MNTIHIITLLLPLVVSSLPIDLASDYFQGFEVNETAVVEYIASRNPHLNLKRLPPIGSLPLDANTKVLTPGEIPDYVLAYCPKVHLYTEETYLPYDIADYVRYFHVETKNHTVIHNAPLSLPMLASFAKNESLKDEELFLTSDHEFDNDPEWLTGKLNKPDLSTGRIRDAPSTLIVVDKGNGWVDAYWFYFYSFNLGPFVMGHGPYGNHIGDWEHSLTRFYKGIPVYVWMSAHGGGGAYYYSALEKTDTGKPVIFSARGTHANYPSTGQHSHDLPFGILSDFTDRGALWDPSLNYLGYTWDGSSVSPVNNTSKPDNDRELAYGDWLLYDGRWGDDKLPPNDPRQRWSPWEWKYIEGPTGPLTKHLERSALCQRAKWYNFAQRCPAKKFISLGHGPERESGVVCADLWHWVRPLWAKWALEQLTWGGGLCWLSNAIWG